MLMIVLYNNATDLELGSGGAIQATYLTSSFVLIQTTFLENFASSNGGAISSHGDDIKIN